MRERVRSICCFTFYAFIGWFLCVALPGIEPTTSVYWDDALTNWAPGQGRLFSLEEKRIKRRKFTYQSLFNIREFILEKSPRNLRILERPSEGPITYYQRIPTGEEPRTRKDMKGSSVISFLSRRGSVLARSISMYWVWKSF